MAMREALVVAVLASGVLPLVRLWRGPTLWDRLVGASSLHVRVVLALALWAALWERPVLLDVALAYAVLGFLGTVLVARFGERGEH